MRSAAIVLVAALLIPSAAALMVRGQSCCCAPGAKSCPMQRGAHSCEPSCGMRSAEPSTATLPAIAAQQPAVLTASAMIVARANGAIMIAKPATRFESLAYSPESPPPKRA